MRHMFLGMLCLILCPASLWGQATYADGRLISQATGAALVDFDIELPQLGQAVHTLPGGYFSVELPAQADSLQLFIPAQQGYCAQQVRLPILRASYGERSRPLQLPPLSLQPTPDWQGWVVDPRQRPVGGTGIRWGEAAQRVGTRRSGEFVLPMADLQAHQAGDSIALHIARPGYHPRILHIATGCSAQRPSPIVLRPTWRKRLRQIKARTWLASAGSVVAAGGTAIWLLFSGLPFPNHR